MSRSMGCWSKSRELSENRLVSFIRTAVDHLHGRRSLVQQDRNDAEPAAAPDGDRRE
jgi:hypothetical protein